MTPTTHPALSSYPLSDTSSPRQLKRSRPVRGDGGSGHEPPDSLASSPQTTTLQPARPPGSHGRSKLPRLDRPERPGEEFSHVIKSKLMSYTRTGQACDRCKVRKIRCDALPQGCSHCASQNLECYVTDRITGRTERRGYLQEVETEKMAMQAHIQQLQKLLQDNGVEVLPWQYSPYSPTCPPDAVLDGNGNVVHDGTEGSQWTSTGSVWHRKSKTGRTDGESGNDNHGGANAAAGYGHRQRSNAPLAIPTGQLTPAPATAASATSSISPTSAAPQQHRDSLDLLSTFSRAPFMQSSRVEGYLGVFADRAPLSSVSGTQVSILGTVLDIGPPGIESEPIALFEKSAGIYNQSLGSFLRSYMNINPPLEHVELPSRSDAFEYSEWYFLMVYPFLPVLHKPTHMALLTRIYDDAKFQPTTSELVIVHMVFANIYFQYGVRNREDPSRQVHWHELANKHYHWAVSKFYHVTVDCSVSAVQAMTLVATYTRGFPKPSCCSTICNMAIMKAVDLGLHRASHIPDHKTNIQNELRKRAWWNALMLGVTLDGRLGRPMPIGINEFDTELPLAIADEYLTDDGITDLSKIGQCPFLVGLHAIKYTPIYMEMFSGLYGARRDPHHYESIIRNLERQHYEIEAALPDDINYETCKPTMKVCALYAQAITLEFRLCLRHPSVCMTNDPQFCAENTRVCEEASRKLLKCVQRVVALKSLDTTWYQMSVYCAAMFSTLAGVWERRHKTTQEELDILKDDTSVWLSIIAEISLLAGFPHLTSSAVRRQPLNSKLTEICARTIYWIERDMPQAISRASETSLTQTSSVARHLETAARQKLEVRLDMSRNQNLDHPPPEMFAQSVSETIAQNMAQPIPQAVPQIVRHGTPHQNDSSNEISQLDGSSYAHMVPAGQSASQVVASYSAMALSDQAGTPANGTGYDHRAGQLTSNMTLLANADGSRLAANQDSRANSNSGSVVASSNSTPQYMFPAAQQKQQQVAGLGPQPTPPNDNAALMTYGMQAPQQPAHHIAAPAGTYAGVHTSVVDGVSSMAGTPTMAGTGASVLDSPWAHWTAAIVEGQDNPVEGFGANALLDLSMLHRRLAPPMTMADAMTASTMNGTPVGAMGTSSDMTAQSAHWPLVLFSNNADAGI